jgi:vacuolar-type H+-ATPase subunit I/STV1
MQLSKPKQMNTEKVTTRLQLQGYGATRYQTEAITKNLTSVSKQGRAYAYPVSDVIASIRDYLQRPRIKPTTSQSLKAVSQALQQRLNNVIEVPFGRATDPEINKLARQLTQAMSRTDSALAELKATAATIKAKYNM